MTSLVIMGNLQHIFLKLSSLGIDFEEDYMWVALWISKEIFFSNAQQANKKKMQKESPIKMFIISVLNRA